MRNFTVVAFLFAAAAGSASAQASIDSGMTKDQVIARLGKPATEHSSGNSTYLFYPNGQEKTVGMSDLITLRDGKVVDAVFRSNARKYTGKSSSPTPVSADAAIAKGKAAKAPANATDAKRAPDTKKAPDTTAKNAPAPTKKP
jgi:outer membrane protein assembly factor BamE (lipoprotein component of BamABCDE complex)